MKKNMRTTIYFDAFEAMHSIINEWTENSSFSAGGLFIPKFTDENNASYCFNVSKDPRIRSYIAVIIKNGKVKLQGWSEFDKKFRDGIAHAGVFIPLEVPLLKISFWGFLYRRKQKTEFKQLINKLGLNNL